VVVNALSVAIVKCRCVNIARHIVQYAWGYVGMHRRLFCECKCDREDLVGWQSGARSSSFRGGVLGDVGREQMTRGRWGVWNVPSAGMICLCVSESVWGGRGKGKRFVTMCTYRMAGGAVWSRCVSRLALKSVGSIPALQCRYGDRCLFYGGCGE